MGIFAVDELLGGSGFSRDVIAADRRDRGGSAGFRDAFHHFDDLMMRVLAAVDGGKARHRKFFHFSGFGIFNPVDEPQIHGMTAVGEHAVAPDDLERGGGNALSDRKARDGKLVPAFERAEDSGGFRFQGHTGSFPVSECAQRAVQIAFSHHQRNLGRADVAGMLDDFGNGEDPHRMRIPEQFSAIEPSAPLAVEFCFRGDDAEIQGARNGNRLHDRTRFEDVFGDPVPPCLGIHVFPVIGIEGRTLGDGENVSRIRIGHDRICRAWLVDFHQLVKLLLQDRLERFPDCQIEIQPVVGLFP